MVLGLSAQNSGFEDDIALEWDNIAVSPLDRSTAQAHSGLASLRVVLPVGDFQTQRPQWPASGASPAPGAPASAEAWVYASSSVALHGRLMLECSDAGDVVIDYQFTPEVALTNDDWTHLSGAITATAGTAGWKVIALLSRSGVDTYATGDVVYVDDVQVDVVFPDVAAGPGWYVGHPMGA